jgi:hypothetical protein
MKIIIFSFLLLSNCAHHSARNSDKLVKSVYTFNITDKNGKYLLERDSGLNAQKQLVLKQKTVQINDDKVIEQSIVMSTPGALKKSIPLLRPFRSQYTIWFEGKKYFTETRLDAGKRGMVLKFNSPDKEWNGEKFVELPKGTGAFCYFSQLIECVRFSTFVDQAIEKTSGEMNLNIIWEGYPFFHQQYPDMTEELVSAATFSYDGKNENGEYRFSLKFQGQTIFYLLDDKLSLTKMLWVSQGLSQIRSKL